MTEVVVGSIKFFDLRRGYGFVALPSRPDAIIHGKVLRACGFTTTRDGSTICCAVDETPTGLRVASVTSIDESTAIPARTSQPRNVPSVEKGANWQFASVRSYSQDRGYGFVGLHDNPEAGDVFVHAKTIRRAGIVKMRPRQRVWVIVGVTPHGLAVADIEPVVAAQ